MTTIPNEKIVSSFDIGTLSNRFPNFELSYETISHKKVSTYNLALAIPTGKKYYAWFSFYKNEDVLFILELNKEKKIVKASIVPFSYQSYNRSLSLGTILYGVILPDTNVFIIEDIYCYEGIVLKKMTFGEKLYSIHDFLENKIKLVSSNNEKHNHSILFMLPILWYSHNDENLYPKSSSNINQHHIPEHLTISYSLHHIQYRCLSEISPFINFPINKKIVEKEKEIMSSSNSHSISSNPIENKNICVPPSPIVSLIPDFTKPQYKYPTIFKVIADIQFDIYHLFAYGKNKCSVYYNVAYIPNVKTSIFMNTLFRNIKENKNLDYIEESDDETDFEDIREDKYVDLQKVLYIECQFHSKFNKWMPIRIVKQPCKVVHISQLVRHY